MSDALFSKTLKEHNGEINEEFLRAWAKALAEKPVLDAPSWGFVGLFAQEFPMEFRQELQDVLDTQADKPYGCVLCGEQEATKYHCYAGRVCADCHASLPKE